MFTSDQRVARHQNGQPCGEGERPGDERQITCVRQATRGRAGTEGQRAEQRQLLVVEVLPAQFLGLLRESREPGDSISNAGRTQVFPVLDLFDVTPVDVPELLCAAVVVPILVREFPHIRH